MARLILRARTAFETFECAATFWRYSELSSVAPTSVLSLVVVDSVCVALYERKPMQSPLTVEPTTH